MLQLERATPVLGTSFVERMTGSRYAVLKIGNETFTRHQLVRQIGTGNFRAARILSELCKKLDLASVKDLSLLSPYELADAHGVGNTTLFVLMSLFEAKGIDALRWYNGGTKGREKVDKTFDSLKHDTRRKDRDAAKGERKSVARAKHRQANKTTSAYLKRQHATRPPAADAAEANGLGLG